MILVTSISVFSYSLDYLDIFWKLDSQDSFRIEEYDFYILRSIDGAAGPWTTLAGPFHNTYNFRDPDVQQLHKWRNYFYKIKVVHRVSGREEEFGPEWHRAEPDRIALEIQRREAMLWRNFAGRLVFLYPRLTFGQRCKHCWDQGSRGNSTYRPVQQNCATCMDVTFVGGYTTPMPVWLQIDPSPKAEQKTDLKEHQFSKTTARTVVFPPIRVKDMLVERENRRWVVERVSTTEKGRAVIRQELIIKELPKDDIAYAVPINSDVDREHTDSRLLARPQSLQQPHSFGELDKMKDWFLP